MRGALCRAPGPRADPGDEGAEGTRAVCLRLAACGSDVLLSDLCWCREQSPGEPLVSGQRGQEGKGAGAGVVRAVQGSHGDFGRRGRCCRVVCFPLLTDLALVWLHQVAQVNPCGPQGNQRWGCGVGAGAGLGQGPLGPCSPFWGIPARLLRSAEASCRMGAPSTAPARWKP